MFHLPKPKNPDITFVGIGPGPSDTVHFKWVHRGGAELRPRRYGEGMRSELWQVWLSFFFLPSHQIGLAYVMTLRTHTVNCAAEALVEPRTVFPGMVSSLAISSALLVAAFTWSKIMLWREMRRYFGEVRHLLCPSAYGRPNTDGKRFPFPLLQSLPCTVHTATGYEGMRY